jgi:hypothetical protein
VIKKIIKIMMLIENNVASQLNTPHSARGMAGKE